MLDRHHWPSLEAENQAELLAYLGTASCAESYHSAEITWVITGVDSNDYNGYRMRRSKLLDHLKSDELEQHYRQASDAVARSHWQILWLLSQGARLPRLLRSPAIRRSGFTRLLAATIPRVPNRLAIAGITIRDSQHCSRLNCVLNWNRHWKGRQLMAACGRVRKSRAG